MNQERWQALNETISGMSPQQRASWYEGLSDEEQWKVSQAYAKYAASFQVGLNWQFAYFRQHRVALVALRVAFWTILVVFVIGAYLLLR